MKKYCITCHDCFQCIFVQMDQVDYIRKNLPILKTPSMLKLWFHILVEHVQPVMSRTQLLSFYIRKIRKHDPRTNRMHLRLNKNLFPKNCQNFKNSLMNLKRLRILIRALRIGFDNRPSMLFKVDGQVFHWFKRLKLDDLAKSKTKNGRSIENKLGSQSSKVEGPDWTFRKPLDRNLTVIWDLNISLKYFAKTLQLLSRAFDQT